MLTSKQRLELDAGLAAGYKMVIREISKQAIVYANDVHFHPLSNFAQAVQLALDVALCVSMHSEGVSVETCDTIDCVAWREDETKIQTICRAIVECV